MPRIATALIVCGACGSPATSMIDAPAVTDTPLDGSTCIALSGSAPRQLAFPDAGAEGEFDASFATDPTTGRIWMAYTGIADGPRSALLESTRLAYTDDHGASFCDVGAINAAITVTDPPPELVGLAAFWVHEVPQLVYEPGAPAAERWQLYWHRYIVADTQDADDRQFVHGWIGARFADDPRALAQAPEHKLLAAAGYALAQAYNDGVLGPPEIQLDQVDPALASCAVFTEPGAIAMPDDLFVALTCGDPDPTQTRIVLVARARATGTWRFVSRLLGAAEAQLINPALDGYSAPALFARGADVAVIATPTAGGTYKGCVGYGLTLPTGTVTAGPQFSLIGTTDFNGACGYVPELTASGIMLSEHFTTAPQFALFATGQTP